MTTTSAVAGFAWVTASPSQHEPRGERIGRVEQVLRGAGDPGASGDRRDNRLDGRTAALTGDLDLLDEPTNERGTDERLVDEIGVESEFPTGVQLGHPGAGAGTAGRAVEPARVDHHRVPRVPGGRAGCRQVHVVASG